MSSRHCKIKLVSEKLFAKSESDRGVDVIKESNFTHTHTHTHKKKCVLIFDRTALFNP